MDENKRYGIWAVRSSGSIFGSAGAWCKHDGIYLLFSTMEAAEMQAEYYNREANSPNVCYAAKVFS